MALGFDSSVCDVLRKPLQEHTRRGPGGSYRYHKGSDVVRRLNEAFGHAWSSERLEERVLDDHVLLLVAVSVVNKDGDEIVHQGYGSAQIARRKDNNAIIDIGNTYKSAYTGALKKAAEQFGIGLGAEDEDEVSTETPSRVQTPYPERAPMRPQGASRPPMQSPGVLPSRGGMSRPEPLPPRVAAGSAPAASKMTSAQMQDTLDRAAAHAAQTAPAAVPNNSPVAGTPDLSGLTISDTQLKALTNLARMKSLDEKALVQSAGFGDKTFKELTRTEAMMVIKHTNTLPQG